MKRNHNKYTTNRFIYCNFRLYELERNKTKQKTQQQKDLMGKFMRCRNLLSSFLFRFFRFYFVAYKKEKEILLFILMPI